MRVPEHIFREYDIRGLADTELTDDLVRSIGTAFGSVLAGEGKRKISVGYDMRPSSTRIHKALVQGLTRAGMDIVDLGLVPTPLLYFSVSHWNLDGGISITGSHNPVEYNGLKLHLADRPFYGAEIRGLLEVIDRKAFTRGEGTVEKKDIIGPYKSFVEKIFCPPARRLKLVVDSGHGMGAVVAPDLLRALGHEIVELYSNLDPAFPDHHPDPSVPENLRDLQKKVIATKADAGIGFDGDADRIGVVDEKGKVIFGDKLLLLYARAVLGKNPGASVIGDVKCSQVLYDDIRKHGGNPIMWKTGHSLIKAKLKETGALLAGEMSGHMFFVERWFGFDDAIYSACRLAEILAESGDALSEMLSDVPVLVSTPEIRVDCPDRVKFELVRKAVEVFKKEYEVIDIDGARILFKDGAWALVRASNTQPVLVMRFEASSQTRLDEIRAIVEGRIQALGGGEI